DRVCFDPNRNISGLNEMAANTHGQPEAATHDPQRKPYGRAARRPVEAREPIALPVLTEAGRVLEVVGPEVHDRRARAARGPGGKGDGSESEDGQQGAPSPSRGPGGRGRGRGRRRAAAQVTRTAA